MSDIKLYSTLTRRVEDFEPITPNEVGIYTCGPTVYNYAHIGNLRAYVFADTLRRMFEFNDYRVKQVINITDVGHLSSDEDSGEDKLEKGAKREGKSVWEIADFYTKAFTDDLKALNIETPEIMPKATDNIAEMILLIQTLEKNGMTYASGGNVYFDTAKFSHYFDLSGADADNNRPRVDEDADKKHSADFVLWFTNYKYANHAMLWDSPWGKGFPGWHIECSAMATKYLGEHFDIHTGGIDHIPVHHTNEIAQSEGAFGHRWINYWMHNNFINIKDGQKMAKSTDNFLRLQTLVDKGYSPLDYRYYLLGGHYRAVMNFSFEALDGARNARIRLNNTIKSLIVDQDRIGNRESGIQNIYLDLFRQRINSDLATPEALAIVWQTVDDKELSGTNKIDLCKEYDKVLGLDLFASEKLDIPKAVIKLAEDREVARKEKDWDRSDKLRQEIAKLGYDVLDRANNYELIKK